MSNLNYEEFKASQLRETSILRITEEFLTSPTTGKLNEAFALAKSEFKPSVPCNGKGHFNNKFATLADMMDRATPALSKHGLTVSQFPSKTKLVTELSHMSGEWKVSIFEYPPHKNEVWGVASMVTYAKRYCYGAIIGLAGNDEEDDGMAAQGPGSNHYGSKGDGGGHRVQPDNGPSRGSNGGNSTPALTEESVFAAASTITNKKEFNQARGMMNRAAKLQVLHGEKLNEVASMLDKKQIELETPALEESTY